MKKLYTLIISLAILLISNVALGQYNLLFVGDQTNSGDAALISYLEFYDYSVTPTLAADFKANFTTEEAYLEYDVLFISEIVGSGDVVVFKDAGYPIPCVTTEGYAARTNRWSFISDDETEFKQASSDEYTEDIKTLIIDDSEHYITKKFEEQEVLWTNNPIEAMGVTGNHMGYYVDGAIQLASYKDASMMDFPTLWAIPAFSTEINTGQLIYSNIVVFGAIMAGIEQDIAGGIPGPTDAFYTIILRSLEWVTENEQVEVRADDIASQIDVKVYPNPASGVATVTFKGDADSVVLSNLTGRKVAEYLTENNRVTFDTKKFSPGIYFITINNHTQKFIIR